MCVFFIGSGYTAYATPVSFVEIDTDASIRMNVNMFNRVISVEPLNDKAKILLEDSDKRHAASVANLFIDGF